MNRRTLIRKIAKEAQRQHLDWRLAREGAGHSIFDLDGLMFNTEALWMDVGDTLLILPAMAGGAIC